MDHKKIFTLLLGFWSIIAVGQPLEVISSAGDYFDNGSGSISFTIGECLISTENSATLILTQGFQQPIVVVEPNSINKALDFNISVFPNPVQEHVILKVEVSNGLHYLLYDIKGALIERNQLHSAETEIDFSQLGPSTYILKIFKNTEAARTFKIIKK
jgi:hypothetical protein